MDNERKIFGGPGAARLQSRLDAIRRDIDGGALGEDEVSEIADELERLHGDADDPETEREVEQLLEEVRERGRTRRRERGAHERGWVMSDQRPGAYKVYR